MSRWRRFQLTLMYVDWSRVASKVATFFAVMGLAWFISTRIVEGVKVSEIRSCHRLNIVRANDNRNQLADYKFDVLETGLVQASVQKQTGNVPRTKAQLSATAQFVAGLVSATAAKQWIALTPCHRAVYSSYKPPEPVYFNVKLPPKTALYLGPEN